MKKLFFFAVVAAALTFAPRVEAQYSRREVEPPVAETVELDPSTPLGKVREIAEKLKKIEEATEEIGRALEAHKIPDYKTSIDDILEAAGATRAEVARLGEIASGVEYIAGAVETIEANTAAISVVAKNVATAAQYLSYVPTSEAVDAKFAAAETSMLAAVNDLESAQTAAILTAVDDKIAAEKKALNDAFAEYRASIVDDAAALKNKLETASNIIILLGLAVGVLLVVNVAKWISDKAAQAKAERDRRDAEFQALLAANSKKTTTAK